MRTISPMDEASIEMDCVEGLTRRFDRDWIDAKMDYLDKSIQGDLVDFVADRAGFGVEDDEVLSLDDTVVGPHIGKNASSNATYDGALEQTLMRSEVMRSRKKKSKPENALAKKSPKKGLSRFLRSENHDNRQAYGEGSSAEEEPIWKCSDILISKACGNHGTLERDSKNKSPAKSRIETSLPNILTKRATKESRLTPRPAKQKSDSSSGQVLIELPGNPKRSMSLDFSKLRLTGGNSLETGRGLLQSEHASPRRKKKKKALDTLSQSAHPCLSAPYLSPSMKDSKPRSFRRQTEHKGVPDEVEATILTKPVKVPSKASFSTSGNNSFEPSLSSVSASPKGTRTKRSNGVQSDKQSSPMLKKKKKTSKDKVTEMEKSFSSLSTKNSKKQVEKTGSNSTQGSTNSSPRSPRKKKENLGTTETRQKKKEPSISRVDLHDYEPADASKPCRRAGKRESRSPMADRDVQSPRRAASLVSVNGQRLISRRQAIKQICGESEMSCPSRHGSKEGRELARSASPRPGRRSGSSGLPRRGESKRNLLLITATGCDKSWRALEEHNGSEHGTPSRLALPRRGDAQKNSSPSAKSPRRKISVDASCGKNGGDRQEFLKRVESVNSFFGVGKGELGSAYPSQKKSQMEDNKCEDTQKYTVSAEPRTPRSSRKLL